MSNENQSHTLSENCGGLVVLAFLICAVVLPTAGLIIGLRHDKGLRQDRIDEVTIPSHGQKRFITLPIVVVEEYVWQSD